MTVARRLKIIAGRVLSRQMRWGSNSHTVLPVVVRAASTSATPSTLFDVITNAPGASVACRITWEVVLPRPVPHTCAEHSRQP